MPPRILIVDDDCFFRKLLRLALEQEGIETATAGNGIEALEALRQETCALLIVDLQMPVMDGVTFLRTLREQGQQQPAVVLSGYAEPSRAQDLVALGAAEVLQKPVAVTQIISAVKRVLTQT